MFLDEDEQGGVGVRLKAEAATLLQVDQKTVSDVQVDRNLAPLPPIPSLRRSVPAHG